MSFEKKIWIDEEEMLINAKELNRIEEGVDEALRNAKPLLSGSTDEITPQQVADAIAEGRNVLLAYNHPGYGVIHFTDFALSEERGAVFADGLVNIDNEWTAYQLGGYVEGGRWESYTVPLALKTDIPARTTVDATLTQPGAAADSAVVGEQIKDLSEEIADLTETGPDELTEEQKASWRDRIGAFGFGAGAVSANLYDPSLQTPETIAPHYYVKGVPYSSTNYDTMWNCTAPVPVKPNTMYTVGLVPAYHYVYGTEDILIEKPWSHAGNGTFFYDADGNYISGAGETNTFTTPANCASIRFNYIVGKKIKLAELNARCMLVEGATLPTTYEPFGTTNSAAGIADVLSENGLSHYEYKNNVLTVYQNGTKIMYGYSGNNNIMMCKGYGLVDAFVPFTTDILSPMILTASENADGDLDDSYRLTGGNHSYAQTSGTPSANTVLVEVFADGKPAEETGLFNTLTLHARHEVQAWNTEKADGTGRAVLVEDDFIMWDGKRMNVEIHLTPTEKVAISEYYGLQLAEINSCNVYGGKVKKNIATGGYSDEVPYFIEGICNGFRIRMHLDETGLGKYTYNTTAIKYSKNDYRKAYFRPIGESHSFTADDCLWLRGYFEILPPADMGNQPTI